MRPLFPRLFVVSTGISLAASIVLTGPLSVSASASDDAMFRPDHLLVSRSVYRGTASTVSIGQPPPPNCPSTAKCAGPAIDDGSFPANGSANNVWNNDTVDGSFGVTSPIFLDQMTPQGHVVSSMEVDPRRIVTSFSSRSELALNLSTDRNAITFMGYVTPVNTLDASNANTPGVIDPTNPVGETVYRAVAELDDNGRLSITQCGFLDHSVRLSSRQAR
jgi:hypothetical protein